MASQSEYALEEELVGQLAKQGWSRIAFEDMEHFETNFRSQLQVHNKKVFADEPLSDAEFRRILAHIKDRGVFESAMLLREPSHTLSRDNGTTVHYSLFNEKEWCKNNFQVAQQVETTGDTWQYRYDVTLLVNGLPLVQVELKRRGVPTNKAFNQIARYQQDNGYKGLFNFVQFFVVSNGVNTRYFANSDKPLENKFAFRWTDEKNNQYESLADFASKFFDRCWTAKMVARYMVVQESDRKLIIMRPYQVYGTERMVARAMDTGNNGFIWHTTGSGKTLTSFKVSQLLASLGKFTKVFFLVDRRDLNKQTVDEFQRFDSNFTSSNGNTYELVKNIKSRHVDQRLIVTTIQKLDKALKSDRHAKVMDELRDESVAFIVDECHRTQFGDMQRLIRSHFRKSQHFGFTGTPRLPDNRSLDGRTTADVFGECIHTYLLKSSIGDKNTLPFSVEYVQTMELKGDIEDGNREFSSVEKDEALHSPERIKIVVQDIIDDRRRKSRNKQFNAMLTVDSVKSVATYMDAFKRASEGLPEEKRLVVATVYSFDANEALGTGERHPRVHLERYIKEYNERFNTSFSTTDTARYNNDVQDKFKKGLIDILVVVDMMLTGFDSKILNTLYVDRNFEHHSLMQAYSRTNRIHNAAKPVGHIRCYRNLKEKTDEAIRLFSNVDNVNDVLALPFEERKERYEAAVEKLKEIAGKPSDVLRMESEAEKHEFVLAFRDFVRELRKFETFAEFNHDDYDVGEQEIEDYRSHYLDIKHETDAMGETTSVLGDIDFRLEEVLVDVVNVDYIFRLLADLDVRDKASVDRVRKMVDQNGTNNLRQKIELLLAFLDEVVPTLPDDANALDSYERYADEKTREIAAKRSADFGISPKVFLSILDKYRFEKKFDHNVFDKECSLGFMDRLRRKPEFKELIVSLSEVLDTDD